LNVIHGGDVYRNQVDMDFSVNINPLGMPEGLEKILSQAAKKCQFYPDIEAGRLKLAVSLFLNIPKNFLLFGNGASELFMGIVHALKPRKILIPIPSFYGYEYAAKAVEADIVFLDLEEEDLLDSLTEKTDLLFLANPNNPTGKLIDRGYLLTLLDRCKSMKITVVLDESFIEFCGSEYSMLSEIYSYDNLIIVRSFTKLYAIPGVRLGYLINSSTSLIEKIGRQLPEWNISSFAQEAGIACAGESKYVIKTVEYVKKERQFLEEGLKEFGIRVFESEANFILVYTGIPLYEKLLQKNILIRDCSNFRGLSKGYYRIAVKQRKDNERLLKVIGECVG
jgi:L-threonine-O-3-phosphate decarboxylase